MIVPVYSDGLMIVTLSNGSSMWSIVLRLGHGRGVVDDQACPPLVRWATYSTDGAVAMSERSNSRSRRSRTISMCNRPRKPQRNPKPRAVARLGLVGDARVVQLELLERLAQVRELVPVDRVQAAEHHGLRVLVALERLEGGPASLGDGLADPGLAHVLDAGDEVAHLARAELVHLDRRGGPDADLFDLVGGARLQEPESGSRAQGAVDDPDRAHDAPVLVVVRVEEQRPQRVTRVALWSRDTPDDLVEQRRRPRRRSWRRSAGSASAAKPSTRSISAA